jgi:NADH:ubiquinone oxidoreductase subunit C
MIPELREQLAAMLGVDDVPAVGMLVARDRHLMLAKWLRDHGYSYYVTVVASHWPAQPASKTGPETPERFEVATVLRSLGGPKTPQDLDSTTFSWRVQLAPGESMPSLAPLYAGADWQEREQFDLVGVPFADHPNLRRLMMDDDWPGHPLRRDYAIDTPHAPWR